MIRSRESLTSILRLSTSALNLTAAHQEISQVYMIRVQSTEQYQGGLQLQQFPVKWLEFKWRLTILLSVRSTATRQNWSRLISLISSRSFKRSRSALEAKHKYSSVACRQPLVVTNSSPVLTKCKRCSIIQRWTKSSFGTCFESSRSELSLATQASSSTNISSDKPVATPKNKSSTLFWRCAQVATCTNTSPRMSKSALIAWRL